MPDVPRTAPKISVIIASYSPGDAVNRVIDSLDAQTLPQEEFEVIFVDDGSPDDTVERLKRIASTRPNIQVFRIENSGWPSRPRNVGIEHATGEYVMFMDHDDSLYPNGLKRAWEYAHENDADLLSPKESKTNDIWWGMSSLTEGNIPNALTEERVHRIMPLVPHKLYRRQLILDHNIRFPEGPRVLWEDWYINLDVYRHAKTVSILADEPVYLWHASDTNSSHSFNPARSDFWDRLDQMMDHIDRTLDGRTYKEDRLTLLAHNVRTRVIDRCVRLLSNDGVRDPRVKAQALKRSQALLKRYGSDEVLRRIPKKHQAQVILLRSGDADLVRSFHLSDLALTANVVIEDVRWLDGKLRYEARARWEPKDAAAAGFRVDNGRLLRVVDPAVRRILPPALLDHTDDLAELQVDIGIRSRAEHVTWALPFTTTTTGPEITLTGAVAPTARGTGWIDIDTARLERPLEDTVWDVRFDTQWIGMQRKGPLGLAGPVMPALVNGRAAVAYANNSRGLTVDLAQRLRTLPADAKPKPGPAGPVSGFSTPLTLISVFGSADLAADNVVAIPDAKVPAGLTKEEAAPVLEALAAEGGLGARIVASGASARLEGSASLAPGRYTLYARREGELFRTTIGLTVGDDQQVTVSA